MSMFNHMVPTQDSRKILSLKVFLVSSWSSAGHFSENKGKIIMKCNFQIFHVKIVIKAPIICTLNVTEYVRRLELRNVLTKFGK